MKPFSLHRGFPAYLCLVMFSEAGYREARGLGAVEGQFVWN